MPLGAVRRVLGPRKAVQGNLDPAALFAPPMNSHARPGVCCGRSAARPGTSSIGHGIWPQTDPDAAARLVDVVHERSTREGPRA
ncbi:uroporphyrinogen decarboxylase [mine drainage metagenome]|uniref:Uroporphyrinogen decarboxylase n=1 Tax=mine drainage metagenome TaxID=410659 RepID=T1AUF5_9ZZZZ